MESHWEDTVDCAEGCVARERHLAARGDVSCQFSHTVLRCAHVHKVDRQKMSSRRMDNFNPDVLSPVSVQKRCAFVLFIYLKILSYRMYSM